MVRWQLVLSAAHLLGGPRQGQLIVRLELLVRGQHQYWPNWAAFGLLGSFFASLVRVRGGYHAMMGSGMRASTPRRAAFLYRVLLRAAPAKEKRLHAVN